MPAPGPARGGLILFGSVLPSSDLRQPRSRRPCVALLATGRTEEDWSESSLGEESEEVPSRSGCRSWSSRPGSRAARTRAGARADGRTDGPASWRQQASHEVVAPELCRIPGRCRAGPSVEQRHGVCAGKVGEDGWFTLVGVSVSWGAF